MSEIRPRMAELQAALEAVLPGRCWRDAPPVDALAWPHIVCNVLDPARPRRFRITVKGRTAGEADCFRRKAIAELERRALGSITMGDHGRASHDNNEMFYARLALEVSP